MKTKKLYHVEFDLYFQTYSYDAMLTDGEMFGVYGSLKLSPNATNIKVFEPIRFETLDELMIRIEKDGVL